MKKFISAALVFAFLATMLPTMALAAEENMEEAPAEEMIYEEGPAQEEEDIPVEVEAEAAEVLAEEPAEEEPAEEGDADALADAGTPLDVPEQPQLLAVDNRTIKVENISYESVRLTWAAVEGATAYDILRSQSLDGEFAAVNEEDVTKTEYTDTQLTTGQTYYYKIVPKANDKRAEEPADETAMAVQTALDSITGLKTQKTYKSITLTWNSVAGAKSYEIQRSLKKDSGFKAYATVTAARYVNSGVTFGKTYYYRVRAVRDGAATPYSGVVSAKTSLDKMGAIKVTSNYKAVELKWSKVPGATKYYVYRSTRKSSGYKKIAQLKSVASYKDTDVSLNATYYYKIVPYRGTAKGSASAVVSAKPALKKAAGVTAKRSGYNSVKLTWKKVSGANKYQVYRATSKKGKYTRIAVLGNVSSYKDTSLKTNQEYFYKIKPYRNNGSGPNSSVVSATPTLASLKNLKAKRASYNSVKLTWTKVAGANKYLVYRSEKENSGYKRVASVGDVSAYTDKKLSTGVTYYYKVMPCRSSAKGNYSKPVSAKATLDKLKDLKAKKQSYNSIKLTWSEVTGANKYMIYRAEAEKGTYTLVGTAGKVKTYTDKGLETGKTYYYKVRPCRGSAQGSLSAQVNAKTSLDKLQSFIPELSGLTEVTLLWEKVAGATEYRIYRSATADGAFTQIGVATGALEYVDSGLELNSTYYYKIRPYRNGVAGSLVGPIAAKTARTLTDFLASPTGTAGNILLVWAAVPDAKGFKIEKATAKKGPWTTVATAKGTATSYTVKALEPGKDYYFKVTPTYNDGEVGETVQTDKVTARASAAVEALIEQAYALTGIRYVSGGKSPGAGFDCSGFVYYALRSSGSGYDDIKYMTSTQWRSASYENISLGNLQPGDIMCFYGHVAIYVGDGMMIDASSGQGKVVYRSATGSWVNSNFIRAKRLF